MKELLLHYIWQHKLYIDNELRSTEGEVIEILNVGKHNTDAGPDFFNAKIKIGQTLWAGNVEIHTHSSDWIKHHHHTDKNYNSVILHVVDQADIEICRPDGAKIPQLELRYPKQIDLNYEQLLSEEKWIACASKISEVPDIFIQAWKNALLTERLEQKMNAINILLIENQHHWEETFYITLARNFGFGTNSQAFEDLAKSLPLSILGKHKENLFQMEALLLGQAGLLKMKVEDEYTAKLKSEYAFLATKYNLQALDGTQWKLMRLRPDNFPHIRIAQFAALIHCSTKLFSKIVERPDIDYLRELFTCQPSQYWQTHFLLGKKSTTSKKNLGMQSINGLLINSVITTLFCYADKKGDETLKEKTVYLLEQIPPEQNSIINAWAKLGINSTSAFDSQALLQLKKMYCEERNCLRCRIGHKVLNLPLRH
jgi:Protein of unknown function (DUF2851)